MCGLVGMAGTLAKKEHDGMFDMLFFDMVRGAHSTGIGTVNRKGETKYYKTTEDGYHFATDPRAQRAVDYTHCVLIGHNRFATAGKVVARNAHPFAHGHILGAHNGTLQNQHTLPDNKNFEVDSESMIYHYSTLGVTETMSKLRGAWAVTWYDAALNTINFLRNKERPLCYVLSEDKKQLFWASEPWILWGALARRGIKFDGLPKHLSEDTHLSWEVPDANVAFGEPFRNRVEGAPEPTPYVYPNQGWWARQKAEEEAKKAAAFAAAYAGKQESAEAGSKEAANRSSTTATDPKTTVIGSPTTNIVPFNPQVVQRYGYQGKRLDEKTYKVLTADGCEWCGSDLFDNERPMWLGEDSFLCPECVVGNHSLPVNERSKTVTKNMIN